MVNSFWSASSSAEQAQTPRTYLGEYHDEETNLSYLNARYYDAGRGQFLSEDPIFLSLGTGTDQREEIALLDPQTQNSYSYARGNPIKFTDDSGKFIETALDVISLTLSTASFYRNPSLANAVFLGLDGIGLVPFIPSAVGYIRHGSQAAKILSYFSKIASDTQRTSDIIRGAELFAKNIAFKFERRSWTAGRAGDSVANLVGHFMKHGDEVGAIDVGDYYNKANEFIDSHKGFSDPFEASGAGDIIHWDKTSNMKVVTNKNGEIKSFHKENRQDKISTYNKIYAE